MQDETGTAPGEAHGIKWPLRAAQHRDEPIDLWKIVDADGHSLWFGFSHKEADRIAASLNACRAVPLERLASLDVAAL